MREQNTCMKYVPRNLHKARRIQTFSGAKHTNDTFTIK